MKRFLCPAIAVAAWLAMLPSTLAQQSAAQSRPNARPKVRTVTAFVRLDPVSYRRQISDALTMLRAARAQFTNAGYEVETIRITSQPFPEMVKGMTAAQALGFFRDYDKLAQQEGFTPDIGAAMFRDNDPPAEADLLAEIIAGTETINGFVVVADDSGIHWNGIRAAAKVIRSLADTTSHSEGNFRFAAAAFPPAIAPFYPVSHTTGAGHEFAIGLESANIVQEAFGSAHKDDAFTAAGERLRVALSREAQTVEGIAKTIAAHTGWTYEGIDLTPVPLKEISIGAAMESLLQNHVGSPGSLSAAFTVTSAVRRVPVKQAGYSGLMLPVLEDGVLAKRWEAGVIGKDALMSYSSVCSTGLDAIPLPGDISQHDLENIISDMASLAVKWHKPLSARLLPVAGKHAGEMTEFSSPYLVNIRIR
ncbi:MAG TPA: DUF711 family protein [Verrucomicrobiae bacterium]|jgi:uncharacterized protein (UPF0210 family)|nr:DUF711 family protein [Verrucomicrobiae bacterium]